MRPFSTSLLPTHNPEQPLYLVSDCTIASWMHLSMGHLLDVAIFIPIATTTSAGLAWATAYSTWTKSSIRVDRDLISK
ncbi:hypothetical protein FJTKL_04258 [Diaporthe vaccinii]|uniref:Uncharacterized protein n=1 Tax=Diaporthe vaccinii TaxID=105482 RepID=A0ABR4F0U1_9PEZI